MNITIKDSGERTEFATGSVRDCKEGVGRMDLLPWAAIMEVSKHCENGRRKERKIMAYIDTKYIGECKTCRHQTNTGCNTWCDHGESYQPNMSKIPVADVVEVVRCKDCIFGHKVDNYHLGYACEKPLYHPAIGERPHRKLMQDCDFCSHGERRE